MRNLKKVLVMVLALAMMLSIMVVGAGAVPEAFTDVKDIDDAHKEAVEIATQLKIIDGFPDKSFQPKGDVTRAQISKMICIALNGGEVPATAVKADPSYNDIKGHWAEGFIEYCTAKGIIAGYPDGSFKPEQPVTGAEAAKMMLVALGYDPKAENYEGEGWDLYVNVQANQDGLYADLLDVDKLTTEPLTREHTAQMIWNMLQAFTVEKTTNVDRTDGSIRDTYAKTETTLFWETYRGYQGTAQMVGFKYDKDSAKWTYYLDIDAATMAQQVGKNQDRNAVSGLKGDFTSKTDYTALLGHDVQVIFNIDSRNATYKANVGKVYGIFNDSSKEIVTAYFGDVAKMTDKNMGNDTVKIGSDTYRLEDGLTFANIPVYEFRSVTDITKKQTFQGGADGRTVLADVVGNDSMGQITRYDPQKFVAIDEDGNDKIDFLLTTPFSFVKVDTLNGTKVQLYGAFVDQAIPGVVLNETSTGKRWLSDQVSMYDGMARGDYVKYTAAANTATNVDLLEKPDEVISGEIKSADYPEVTVNSNVYKFVDEYFYTGKGTTTAASKKGNDLTNAMLVNNYIFRVESLKRVSFDDFAIVTAAASNAGTINGPQAKLLFTNGETKLVDTNTDYSAYVGQLVEWYVRDGDYYLDMVENLDPQGGDYTMSDLVATVRAISNSNSKIGNLYDRAGNWADINDDAVVFVKYLKDNGDVAYKAITGKQLKANPVANFNNIVRYEDKYVASGSVTVNTDWVTYPNTMVLATADAPNSNKNHAEFAYIDLTANGVITSKDYFGYVTATGTDETTGYKTLDLWTVDGQKTVYYADDNILVYDSNGKRAVDPQDDVIKAGMAIRYKTNANDNQVTEILGYYNMETEIMGNKSNMSDDGSTFYASTIAITNLPSSDPNDKFEFVEYVNDGSSIVPNENAYGEQIVTSIAPDNKSFFDIKDAQVLYMDIENDAHVDNQSLDTASRNKAGDYVSNAMIVYEADGTVDLLVYFVDVD